MARLRKLGKSGNYFAYFYDSRKKPKEKSYALNTTRKDVARRRLTKLERRYERDEFDPWNPDSSGPEPLTVNEAIERFIKAKAHLRARTVDTYRQQLERWESVHLPPGVMLRDVSVEHVRPYVLAGRISRASQRKRYRHLKAFFNWSTGAALLESSPMADVRQPKREKKQPAFLSNDDVKKLLRAIDAHHEITENAAGRKPDDTWLAGMIRVAVCTGLRRGELVRLRWRDADLTHRLLTVRSRDGEKTKSGDERRLPLRGDALDVLRRLDRERGDDLDAPAFVDRRGLPIKLGRVTKRFKFFVRKARLRDRKRLHFHSLRHTCGSWLAMQGVAQRVIQGILGHQQASTSEIYMHLSPQAMASAMEETFGGGLR